MTMAFDTLKAMKRLTATGVEEAQAEAIIETVGGAMTESLATKDDLALLKADLTAESAEVRTEIAGTEGRLETKIAEVRTEIAEVRGDITAAAAEARAGNAESDTRNAERYTKIAEGQTTQLRWMVGCMVAIAGVLASTLLRGG